MLIGYTYCISYLILHLPFYHDACYKNKATAGLATPGKSHLFFSGSEDKSWYLQHFYLCCQGFCLNSHGRREAAHPFFYLDCVFQCILKVICKNLISNVFFRQLAKLTPELAPTVVSEHETFESVEQVLGHTSILRISCSKLWRHKFLQQLPKPIEFLRACQKLFGPDTFCELAWVQVQEKIS